jgi:hypothetical protein
MIRVRCVTRRKRIDREKKSKAYPFHLATQRANPPDHLRSTAQPSQVVGLFGHRVCCTAELTNESNQLSDTMFGLSGTCRWTRLAHVALAQDMVHTRFSEHPHELATSRSHQTVTDCKHSSVLKRCLAGVAVTSESLHGRLPVLGQRWAV